MTKKRIILLTQWFEPEPTFKGLVFARALVRAGFDVEVVTGFPNYPGGKLYPGYHQSWAKRESIDGIEVVRLPLYPSHDSSPIRRFSTYASFALSAALYLLFSAKRADLVYVYQLPTLGVVAAMARWFRGSAFVFDIQDIWPDSLSATGMMREGGIFALAGSALDWVYQRCDAIVVLSPGFKKLLTKRGAPAERIEMIYNWADEGSLQTRAATGFAGFPGDGRFRIVFAGNMGKAQGLDAMLDAAELVKARNPRVSFVFIGGGVDRERLRVAAGSRGLNNVEFMARVPMDQIGDVLRAADALVLHLRADPLFTITIPGKTQTYMSIGKPILVAAAGDATQLVLDAGCGVAATPGDGRSIADAALHLAGMTAPALEEMGNLGRQYYGANLSVQGGVQRFIEVFGRAMTARAASPA